MIDKEAFIRYLADKPSTRTGKPIGTRSAQDLASRCARVERDLNLNLEAALKGTGDRIGAVTEEIRNNAGQLGLIGKSGHYYNDFISAVRRYHNFLIDTHDVPRRTAVAKKHERVSEKK
jgi:hypothetical protein